MSGHSKWASIKHKKGAADKKRGVLFSKLSRAIIVAARDGGPDPSANLALANAIEKAKSYSMPKDNIDRAIARGSGADADAAAYETVIYEGYGPDGVGVLALISVLAIMIILLAVLALVVVQALAKSPWGVFTMATTIPVAPIVEPTDRSNSPPIMSKATGTARIASSAETLK